MIQMLSVHFNKIIRLIFDSNMYSTEVEKQEMVLKPYFPGLTSVAMFRPESTGTLLPYLISNVLCFVNDRSPVTDCLSNSQFLNSPFFQIPSHSG